MGAEQERGPEDAHGGMVAGGDPDGEFGEFPDAGRGRQTRGAEAGGEGLELGGLEGPVLEQGEGGGEDFEFGGGGFGRMEGVQDARAKPESEAWPWRPAPAARRSRSRE
jgi:hypothetical protein